MTQGQFKTYQRGRRQYSVDTLFTNGMMFTSGAVDNGFVKTLVNYDIQKEGDNLTPRAGLRVSELVLPDVLRESTGNESEYHTNPGITLMASKDCIEHGDSYKQFILGRPANDDDNEGRMWVCTSGDFEGVVGDNSVVNLSIGAADYDGAPCRYLTVPYTEIHQVPVSPGSQIASIVGTFAFNNGFYFANPEVGLSYTTMKEEDNKYIIEDVIPKQIDPSEAVTFGYNMLAGDKAYSFINEALTGIIQLTGILPYSTKEEDVLLMTPRHNEEIYLRCYFKGEVGKQYKFMWEWRNVGDEDWNVLQSLDKSPIYTITMSEDGTRAILNDGTSDLDHLQFLFKAPTENVLVRVQAYNASDLETVEKAMTVGFDFSLTNYGEATNVKQESYDLSTATGMEFWNNRLVMWGIEKDPTILFISDVNDPSYFPYPNNISIYDEPIVCVKAYLNSLLVFTTNAAYQVTLSSDGISWNSTLIQSDLNIKPWDRHLIQVVRNMVFFKSGDYYYMLVPKAQASTGKLALAPISSNITDFFNYFEKNLSEVLYDTFDYSGSFEIVNYFNYLDYEDIHNVYVCFCETEDKHCYLHFDMLYNINTRSWRIHTFEAPYYLFPYRQDATKRGVLASTSLLNTVLEDGSLGVLVDTVEASEKVTTTSKLVISKEFVDFLDVTDIRVEAVNPYGVAYLDTVLDVAMHDDVEGYVTYSNSEGKIRCLYDLTLYQNMPSLWLEQADGDEIFWYGSKVTIYDNASNEIIWGPEFTSDEASTLFEYPFEPASLKEGTLISINGEQYILTYDAYNEVYEVADICTIKVGEDTSIVQFTKAYETGPIFKIMNYTEDTSTMLKTGRCIQLYEYDTLNLSDSHVSDLIDFKYKLDESSQTIDYDLEFIQEALSITFEEISEHYIFRNWQFLDTGYRNSVLERNKRYRELQLQLNNIEGSNLEFGLEFQLDGQSRLSRYVYETEHVIDVNDPNYGLLYVQATPYMNLPLEYVATPNETILGEGPNTWILNQSLFPELSLWKVRAPVSGKGIAPRMRLLSRNTNRFELMSINWVYRLMNAR